MKNNKSDIEKEFDLMLSQGEIGWISFLKDPRNNFTQSLK